MPPPNRSLTDAPASIPRVAGTRPADPPAVLTGAEGIAAERAQRRQTESTGSSLGRVLLTMLIALAVGALLNADAIVFSASAKEFGPSRDRNLAVWEPVQDVSQKTLLNRPRQKIEAALGREAVDGASEETASVGDNTAPTTPAPTTVVPTTAVSTTIDTDETTPDSAIVLQPLNPTPSEPVAGVVAATTTVPAPIFPIIRTPTPETPIRLLAAGDSMVETFGTSQTRIASETGLFETKLEFRVESGLFRPDFFGWPSFLDWQMRTFDPDVVVIMFGANDSQPYEENGQIFEPFTPTWMNHYQPQVSKTMDVLTAGDRLVIWVTMPVTILGADFNLRMEKLNAIFREEAAKRDSVVIVESWPLFSSPDGGYTAELPAIDGTRRNLRQRDGLHFSTVGGDRLSWSVLEVVNHFADLSASVKAPDADTMAPEALRLKAYTPSGFEPYPDATFPNTPPG